MKQNPLQNLLCRKKSYPQTFSYHNVCIFIIFYRLKKKFIKIGPCNKILEVKSGSDTRTLS